ncbi:MAG: hypothetical protein SFY81_05900 [Verrucomicrobiota bacterium]|nr:hypothetical protein [Verrucomicrobiota bacterium]
MLKRIYNKLRGESLKFARSASRKWSSLAIEPKVASSIQLEQVLLNTLLSEKGKKGEPIDISDYGFRVYSQTEEDGIILAIFSQIGTTTRKCVEIGAGMAPYSEVECNTANLLIHHGWEGLIIDGDPKNIHRIQQFFKTHANTWHATPKTIASFVHGENINDLLNKHDFNSELDLLSLDIDGVDWWVFKALQVTKPRVLILEINDVLPYPSTLTIPYSASFNHREHNPPGLDAHYFGASLGAFKVLAQEKGYRLLGINRSASNAFFLRNDIVAPTLPTRLPEECPIHQRTRQRRAQFHDKISKMSWVDVLTVL